MVKMTNSEKYLKDGISVKEFIEAYLNFSFSRVWGKDENSFDNITKKFFELQVKPQLTEDERVILRNLHYEKGCYEYEKIRRTIPDTEGGSDLILVEKDGSRSWFNEYLHLFQFIKPRRRI